MNVEDYLQRIGYAGPLDPSATTLRSLHRQHLWAVPFENLDIHLQRPITVDPSSCYEKIVQQRRGGFCYELNGLFGWLLRQLGFDVEYLSARVFAGGRLGPEFDHLALQVNLDPPLLADVGFGDSFRDPLVLTDASPQSGGISDQAFQLRRDGLECTLQRTRAGETESLFLLELRSRQLREFAGMCNYHQTSPQSHFTQNLICSRATPRGRITLSGRRLIETTDGAKRERVLRDSGEYQHQLRENFGIVLASAADAEQLWRAGKTRAN